jgi:hypothetical protein
MPDRIEAVSVNHNTSAYLELMLRSLFARHGPDLPLTLTVYDNASEEDTAGLRAYAASRGIPILPSGFTVHSRHNSHGEVLRRFVLERPACSHYLFLDADICFVQDDTIGIMRRELAAAEGAFGIGARQSWDGLSEIPAAVRAANPDICDARLHPCCALVENSPIFRQVVEEIGFSCARYLWAEREEYLDTFTLLTRVMRTHGRRHVLASCLVRHFFCASYEPDAALAARKAQWRDAALADLRAAEAG